MSIFKYVAIISVIVLLGFGCKPESLKKEKTVQDKFEQIKTTFKCIDEKSSRIWDDWMERCYNSMVKLGLGEEECMELVMKNGAKEQVSNIVRAICDKE